MPTSKRKNVYILAFTLFVVMLGFGVVIPIMPFYIDNLGAGGTELGLLVASYAAMRLVFGPIWGSLSDRVGRKPILMIGVLGYGIAMILFGLSTKLWMLFLSRILSGVLSSATSPTAMAYISDSTSEEERGGGMGMLGAAVGLGTIFGPGLGGLLAGESLSVPFFIAGGMSFLTLGLIWLFLPESLPPAARQIERGSQNLFQIRKFWRALQSPIGILLFISFLLTGGVTIFYGIFGLYALEKFNYGPQEVGTVFMVFGVVSAVAQGILVGPFTRRWGEVAVIKVSLLAAAAGFVFMSWSATYFTILLTIGFFTLATALLSPAITALTSKWATMEQGITMGLSNAAMSLGRILGPLWGGIALDIHLELPYLTGAVVMVVGFVVGLLRLDQKGKLTKLTPF